MAKTSVKPWDLDQVMKELKKLGSAQTVKTFRRHGAEGEMYGVKVGDLKNVLKHCKGNQELAMDLWDTNNSDAMYLAALIADGAKMTKKQLDHWAKTAWWYMLSEYSVPFVAAEHPDAFGIATKWIGRKAENIQTSGWTTYASALSTRDDADIPLDEAIELLQRVAEEIESAPNRVRYCMNGFVISAGCFSKPLLAAAKSIAKKIGKVHVDMGDTACNVPLAAEYIQKVEKAKRVGTKRKSAKC